MLYVVTGVTVHGKRFRPLYTDSYIYAMGINLWRGSVWKLENGKRRLIKRVYN
jgi:hypothetical protein